MQREEKIRYLREYLQIQERIEQETEELARLKSLAVKITPCVREVVSGGISGDGHTLQRSVENIVELERQIDRDVTVMAQARRALCSLIDGVADSRLQLLLRLRYLSGKEWEEIADSLHFCLRHVYRLHKQALDVIECHSKSMISLS